MTWLPIETAPKGVTVIGYAVTQPERWMRVGLGSMVPLTTTKPGGDWIWHLERDWPTATHWMPLPEPPVIENGNQLLAGEASSADSRAQR